MASGARVQRVQEVPAAFRQKFKRKPSCASRG